MSQRNGQTQTQGAVMTTILNNMASKKDSYRHSVKANHSLSLAMADRLAKDGSLEEDLVMMIKGNSEGDENLIPEEEIQAFLTGQRDRLKKLAERNVERDGKIDSFIGVINKLKHKVATDDDEELYADGNQYESIVENLMQEEATLNQQSEKDPKEAVMYKEICERLGDKVKSESGGDDEDDIEVVRNNHENKSKFKCPLTAMWMEDPVKSKVCNHTYSRQGIYNHIARSGKKCNCPYPGCDNNSMTKGELEDDPLTVQLVRRMKRRHEQEEEFRVKSQAMGVDDDDDDEACL